MATPPTKSSKMPDLPSGKGEDFRLLYFSELLKLPVCAGTVKNRLGRLTDLVFRVAEPYPEAIGLYLEHGWGKPTTFIPLDRVLRIEDDVIMVQPPPGETYPPFVDQKGWILIDKHLMGRTILDMDGRRTEVVNDVQVLETKTRLLIVHVDVSFNGFLRRWGLRRINWIKDRLISWKYVQPLSVEDAVSTDAVSLSIARKDIKNLPSEDLADVLEELSGEEQQALFSALDSEKAAETLVEAEPRAQRQLIANLRQERARTILSEMSVPQLADLFSVLPHDDMTELMGLLPKDDATRIQGILSEREATALALINDAFVAETREVTVGQALANLRRSELEPENISYLYIVSGPERLLLGVVDLRELILAPEDKPLGELMISPAVAAEADDMREDLAELFAKYQFRMLPVVDAQDHLLGVVQYHDIMKGLVTRAKI